MKPFQLRTTENELITIRAWKEADDLNFLTLLIRGAYKVLLDKGFRYWGTFQSVEDTRKRLSGGEAFIVERDCEIVGTITLKRQHLGPEETTWYDLESVCYFTQFAVKPELQKTGLGSLMMNFVEDYAKEKGFQEIALDTCENAVGLIKYYTKRGYRFIGHVQWDPSVVNYRSVVLSKSLK